MLNFFIGCVAGAVLGGIAICACVIAICACVMSFLNGKDHDEEV